MLNDACWFNALNSLTEAEVDRSDECMDTQMANAWGRLWDCAGQTLCASIRQPFQREAQFTAQSQDTGLNDRKREELIFSFRNSNLYQLLVCRHAGGSDSDAPAKKLTVSVQSTMRVFRHCAFFII